MKTNFFIIMFFLLVFCSSMGAVSAVNVYNITDESYDHYFDKSTGFINDANIVGGDVLDCSGTIKNKNMIIDRPVNITSSDKTGKILNGTITILTNGSGTNITNMDIENDGKKGIIIHESENNLIKDNNIVVNDEDESYAIYLFDSSENRVTNNNIITTGDYITYGILLCYSDNNEIISNRVSTVGTNVPLPKLNSIYLSGIGDVKELFPTYGIILLYSSNNNITANDVVLTSAFTTLMPANKTYCMNSMNGIDIYFNSNNNQVTYNNITVGGNNPFCYGLGVIGAVWDTTSTSSEDNVFTHNNVTVNGTHFASAFIAGLRSFNTIVTDNNFTANANNFSYGVTLEASKGSTVTRNNISTQANIDYAVELTTSDNNNIADNNVSANGNYSIGVATYDSKTNNITNNIITTSGDNSAPHIYNPDTIPEGNEGIKLYHNSNGNNVNFNAITSYDTYAVNATGSLSNTITNNYLYSDNGNKQGNAAVTGTGNTVSGNYGGMPVANFTASPIGGTSKLAVQFTDTSTNYPTVWAWDFDNDGVIDSTEQNPLWIYDKDGVYTVKLTASKPGSSDDEIKNDYITVVSPHGSLISSSFLGGNLTETADPYYGNNVAIAPDGSIYVVGTTTSADMATHGAYDESINGNDDVFIAHYASNLSQLLACTYLGGSGSDYGHAVAVGSNGLVYVTGYTSSTDFPVTLGSYDNTRGGTQDAFVAMFNPSLSNLLGCTYLGGGANDRGYGITVASDGSVYVTGYTMSKDFAAATEYGYQANLSLGQDTFVAKFDYSLSTLSACTYFGSTGNEHGYGVAEDSEGNIYITGKTTSLTGFAKTGAYDTTRDGRSDGFVAKFNHTLNQLLACTYFGGSGYIDDACEIVVKGDSVYITGFTNSNNLPTPGAYDSTRDGGMDAYVARFNTDLSQLLASTYYGGSGEEKAYGLAVDDDNNVYICGYTDSTNLQTTTGAYNTNSGSQDAFIACFNDSLSSLKFATYYGGSGNDIASSLVLTHNDGLIVVGNTESANLPVKNAVDDSFNNGTDLFVSQWFRGDAFEVPVANFTADVLVYDAPMTVHFSDTSSNVPVSWEWDFDGDGVTDSTQQNPVWTYNTAGTYTVILSVRNSAGADREVKKDYIRVNVPLVPVADFSTQKTVAGVPTTVTVYEVNQTVQFVDNSTNIPTSWEWDFDGDGVIDSHEQNPTYIYSSPGIYTVHLKVANSAGSNTKTKVDYISVMETLSIYSTEMANENYGAPDPGIPGFVGPDGDGLCLDLGANNYLNPIFKQWASTVIDYSPANQDIQVPWTNPTKALGPVTGDNFDIVSLGDLTLEQLMQGEKPGSVTLGFDLPIANGDGPDFAVFENGFISLGGAGVAGEIFAELGYVEVSTDGITFVRFPCISLTPNLVGGYGTVRAVDVYNLVGKHCNAYGYSWGTPFDLDDLVGLPEVVNGSVDLNNINYVKVVDIPGCGFFKDSEGRPIYDAWLTWGSGGVDLEAIGVINTAAEVSPVADFTASPLSGDSPLTVKFTDQSTGNVTGWAWDFNNNGTIDSTERNPSWTYNKAGIYTVKLTVTGPGGSDSEVKTSYITVNKPVAPPVAGFTASPLSGDSPLTVKFTDQSANKPTSWKWEYRKGAGSWIQFSNTQNPSYVFNTAGVYDLRLTVVNSGGSDVLVKSGYINVANIGVTVDLVSGSYNVDKNVTLTANSAADPKPELWYSLDGGVNWNHQPKKVTLNLGEGITNLKFYAVDLLGNKCDNQTRTYIIDKTAPNAAANPVGGFFNTSKTVTLNASDNLDSSPRIYYTLDGSSPTTGSNIYSSPLNISRTTTIRFVAVDDAGNVGDVKTENYVIDVTVPTVNVSLSAGSYNADQSVVLTASDDQDVNPELWYSLDGVNWSHQPKTVTLNLSSEGLACLRFYAVDWLGNQGVIQNRTYIIDKTAPNATANLAEGQYDVPQSVTLAASDNLDYNPRIYYTLDGSVPTTASTLYSGAIQLKNTTTLKFIAVDDAGNPSEVYTRNYTIHNADVYVNALVSNKNPQVGDTVNITFKIGNKGPYPASGVMFTYVVPDNFEFVRMSADTEPDPVYDPSSRTITWNLGDLPVGDPYLYLVLKVIGAGNSGGVLSLTSHTFDSVMSNNIVSLLVNANAPGTGTTLGTGSACMDVNAATTIRAGSVPMQSTGITLVGLMVGVLSVLGGLVLSRPRNIPLGKLLLLMLVCVCVSMGGVAAATYNITNESYINHFDEAGYINDTNIVDGDVLDYSGEITGKDMYIDRPLNIISTDKTGKILNGTFYILPEGSGTNITGLFFNNTNHNGPDYPGTIVLDCANNVTITNNTIITNVEGDDSFGIHMIGSSNNKITGNQIITTGDGTGCAAKAAVDDTGWPGNGKFTYGVYLNIECCNNLIDSNLIHTIGNSATVDWTGWGSGDGGIYPLVGLFLFDGSSYNTIKNNKIHTEYNQEGGVYGTTLGVQFKHGCSNNKLLDNNITTNGCSYGYGMEIVGEPDAWSINNTVSGNTINTTADRVHETQSYANGIKVSAYTENTILSYNDISAVAPRFTYSIYLEDFVGDTVKNIKVIGNRIYGNSDVVYLCEIWLVKGNIISNNTMVGVGNYTMAIATADSDANNITYNDINLVGDNNAPMGPNVDSIPAINTAFTFTQNSDGNFVAYNKIVFNGAQYAISAMRSSNNQFISNYLVSDNGNRWGDASIAAGPSNIVSGNHGVFVPDNPSDPSNPQTNSSTTSTSSKSGLTPGLVGAFSMGLVTTSTNIVTTAASDIGDQSSSAERSTDSSRAYEVSQKDSSSSPGQSNIFMGIIGVVLLLALLALGFFRKKLKLYFKRFTMMMIIMLLCCSLIGAVGAANVYNVTDESYGNYFNESGYINDTRIVGGDVLDVSGTLNNKNMNIDRPLNIISTDKTGKLINGTIKILRGGSGSNVINLTIENHNINGDGIHLYQTENNTIQGNHIHCDGIEAFALPVSSSHHNNIIGNTVITSGYLVGEQYVTHTAFPVGNSTYNLIKDNKVFSDGANCIALTVSGKANFEGGKCYYNTIINNTIVGVATETCIGINMDGSHNQAINNTILSQGFPEKRTPFYNGPHTGIKSGNDNEGGNTIVGNIISASDFGIIANNKCIVCENTIFKYNSTINKDFVGIQVVNDCMVANNTVNMLNGGSGFLLTGSNSTLSGNNVINVVNGYGINLKEASGNTITANTITTTDTSRGSIHLYGSSIGNTFSANIIDSKSTGFTFERKFRGAFPENNLINNNQIITISTYAVNSSVMGGIISGIPATVITNNYLASDNGNKLGDMAVYSITGDTVSGNYGGVSLANFTASANSGTAPLTVHFNDTSTNHPTVWSWNFGDGSTSTQQNPTHIYTTLGSFTVTLTVTNPGGSDTETKTSYITVTYPAPVADFTCNATTGLAPLTVKFNDASIGDVHSYEWDFDNDGIPDSNEKNPTWTYNTVGNYTVKLSVSGLGGADEKVKTGLISVVSDIGVNADLDNGSYQNAHVNLTAFDSIDPNPEVWYSVNNGAWNHQPNKVTLTFNTPGIVNLKFYATNSYGGKSLNQTKTYIIDQTKPTASANPTEGVYKSTIVTLTATDNYDTNPVIYYTINGSNPTTDSTRYTEPIKIYQTTTVKFRAVDAAGNMGSVMSETYTIDTQPPTVTSNQTAGSFKQVYVTLSATDVNDHHPVIWYSVNGGTWRNQSDSVTFNFNTQGIMNLSFYGVDAYGNQGSIQTITYIIDKTVPIVQANLTSGNYNVPQNVALTATDNYDSSPDIYYTTDGSTPTTSSTKYTTPIYVDRDTTLRFTAVDAAGNMADVKTVIYSIVKSISGTVYDAFDIEVGSYVPSYEDVVPVFNATVNLKNPLNNQTVYTTKTDINGYYLFGGVAQGDYLVEILYRTYQAYLQNVTMGTQPIIVNHTFIPDIALIAYSGSQNTEGQKNKIQALMNLSSRVYHIESYDGDDTYNWMLDYSNFIVVEMYGTNTGDLTVSPEEIAQTPANARHMLAYIFGVYDENFINSTLKGWKFVGATDANNTYNSLENTYIGSYWQVQVVKEDTIVKKNMQNLLDYILYLLGESDINPTEIAGRTPILSSSTWGIYHPDYKDNDGIFGKCPSPELVNQWIRADPGYDDDGVGSLNWMTNEYKTWAALNNKPQDVYNAFETWYNSTKSNIKGSFVVIASYYPGGDLVDAMITTYESQGRAVFNLFQSATIPAISEFLLQLTKGANGSGPLDRGVVAVNSLYSWSLDYANMGNGGAIDELTAMNVEIIKALGSLSQYSYTSEFGPQAEWTYAVTIPQFEGVFGAVPVSYFDGEGNEIPVQEGIDKVVQLTQGWAALKEVENEDKKIAVIFYNYPPGKSELGASYLDVFQSLHDFLEQLYDAGYDIGMEKEEIPIATELYTIIAGFGNKGTWAQGLLNAYVEENHANLTANNQLVSFAQYKHWFNELPQILQDQLVAKWGSGLGKIMVYNNESIVIPGIVCGNVFITVQPSRGWEEVENYHDVTLPPHQQYITFYKWLDQVFGADVMIHWGTHGTLEWLPGRDIGLQADDWTFQLSTIPNIYPYIVSNPGEGMVAKDRSFALVISHMTPAIVSSGLYGELVTIHDYIHSYENAVKVDATELAEEYKIKINKTAIEMGFNAPSPNETFNEWLEQLHLKLHELEMDVITLGLHTLGEGLEGYELIQETITIASSRTEIMNNIKNILYPSLGVDYYTMLKDVKYELYIDAVRNNMTYYVTQLVNGTSVDELAAEIGISNSTTLYTNLEFCAQTINDLVTNREWESIMNALSGGYVIPGLSADPSYSDVLPTGTSIYALDTTRMPSQAAWEAAKKIVNLQLKEYYQEHGKFPELISQVMWGTELLRTEGIGIGQFLYYLGVTPTWSITGNGVVTGIALMDLSELTITLDDGTVINRPRIDVLATAVTSNPDWLKLLVGAVYLANSTDEITDVNYVKKHYAENPSLDRIFGLPGAVLEGTGVSDYLPNTSRWENSSSVISDLAEIYLSRISNAWTIDKNGRIVVSNNRNTFEYLLKNTDIVTQNIDSTWRFLDSDDYYDWFGGLLLASQYLGANPTTSIVDIRDKNSIQSRTLSEELEFEVRSMLLNPTYKNALTGTPAGCLEYAARYENLVAFATINRNTDGTGVVSDGIFNSLASNILGSNFATNTDFRAVAYQSMSGWLMQAARKGVWKADSSTLTALANKYIESFEVAVSCCHHTCGNIALNNFAVSVSSLSMNQLQNFASQIQAATGELITMGSQGTPSQPTSPSSSAATASSGASVGDQPSTSSDGDQGSSSSSESAGSAGDSSSKSYEVSEKSSSPGGQSNMPIVAILGVLILIGLMGIGYFRDNIVGFFKK